jgi:hypothetical protein
MEEPRRNKGGRPRKHLSVEDTRAAGRASKRRKRGETRQARQLSNGLHTLNIQIDPRSLLQPAGPEGGGQITLPQYGIQAEGLNIPVDEEQLHFLEVFYLGRIF